MSRSSHRIHPALLLTLAATLVTGEASAHEARTALPPTPCPSTADIEQAVGYPVKQMAVAMDGCMYEFAGRYRGVILTLMYQPATRADDVFADIRRRVTMKGPNAKPESVKLGDGGWGYSSSGRREAAAVSEGRLYHVEMNYELFGSLKIPEDAAIRVIDAAMRVAPPPARTASAGGGTNGAPLDACTLATNEEVSQIAGARPEIAKFWSAPTTSFGGSHCDYDGGSIRIYRGKNPAAALESTLKTFKAGDQPRVPVSGVGDKAFFMIPFPGDKYKRLGLLAVHAGPDVVQLTLDAQGDEPLDATRPRLERLARLVVSRLR